MLGPGGCCKHLLIDYCLNALCIEHEKEDHSIPFSVVFMQMFSNRASLFELTSMEIMWIMMTMRSEL